MSRFDLRPYAAVTLSITTYSTILGSIYYKQRHGSLRVAVKAISACHSIVTTCLSLVALYRPWTISSATFDETKNERLRPDGRLDDSRNPLISGTSSLANFVTAWEAGYLIYDTGALLLDAYFKDRAKGCVKAVRRLILGSPIFFIHHALLASALLYLQTYIAAKREKGLRVIIAFVLMNASNPVLHLRWYRRKLTGRQETSIDTALAFVFAASRFGSVWWVMQQYGNYHGIGSWAAYRLQRTQCQVGTGLLTGVNALWWLALVRQITNRKA